MEKVKEIEKILEGTRSLEILDRLGGTQEKLVFSSSLGYEDQVITHYIATKKIPCKIFTLDTGRLFPETYSVLQSTIEKYSIPIDVFFPDTREVEAMVSAKGPLSFYSSIENRKECCHIRKVIPLKRALHGKTIWITGIRKEQSKDREEIPGVEWDAGNQIMKVHPLLDWKWDDVLQFIKENNIPYNPLHDRGFVSIGCQPCTRAIREGEDFRAGRWWWEDSSKKECGLHFK